MPGKRKSGDRTKTRIGCISAIVSYRTVGWSRRVTRSTVANMESGRESKAPGGDGCIPFTFRIGVTGHRDLADPDALRAPIREAVSRLKEMVPVAPGAGLAPVVVSALAEGADRLVVDEVLADRDARLEVALPLDAEEYAEDFKTEASKEEFRSLLAGPATSGKPRTGWIATRPTSEPDATWWTAATRSSSSGMVRSPGAGEEPRKSSAMHRNTAYRSRGCTPRGTRRSRVTWRPARAEVVKAAAGKLRKYNTGVIDSATFGKHARELRNELMPDMAREIPIDPLGLSRETVAGWVFPYFIRADIQALRYQRRFRRLSWAIFVLAALAVAVVAVQANFWPTLDWLAAFEVAFLVGLLLILQMNRRWRLHDQWISCRFLAERLRSSYFLALAGTGDQRGRSARLAYLSDSSEAWIERALTEVSARRPGLDGGSPPVRELRDYLNRCWIGSQITYQEGPARSSARSRSGWFALRNCSSC